MQKEILDKNAITLLLFLIVISAIGTTLIFVGAVTDTGTVGASITEVTEVNFTIDDLDWGAGSINAGETNATLDSEAGTVTGGSWTAKVGNLTLENIGSENVILNMSSDKDADALVGGTASINSFQWKMAEVESVSCTGATNVTGMAWTEIDTTEIAVCSTFYADDTSDSIKVDFKIVIPSDTTKSGAQTATITAIATEIAD